MRIATVRRILRYDWPLHFVLLLTNWLPDSVWCLRMRGALARRFLGSCGGDLRLGRNVTFYNPSEVDIGRNVYIAYGCWLMAAAPITIGDETMFGPYCVLASSEHTRVGASFRYGPTRPAPISIGAGCWLAAHVTVTAGSQIGDGVLIAASAVVTRNVPSHVMVAGVPGRVVRELPAEGEA